MTIFLRFLTNNFASSSTSWDFIVPHTHPSSASSHAHGAPPHGTPHCTTPSLGSDLDPRDSPDPSFVGYAPFSRPRHILWCDFGGVNITQKLKIWTRTSTFV